MSRERRVYKFAYYSFPRVSGDEPDSDMTFMSASEFSPRERG